ncbi:MAG TPA: hypothetical protein ACFYD3_00520 [Candidatus Hypogeohydataceae bacterium YC41]
MEPTLWFVDDLDSNLLKFETSHRNKFKMRFFNNPNEVLAALKTGHPDVLLCDIYFFEKDKAQEIEDKVRTKVEELQKLASELAVDKHQAGVTLIEEIQSQFNNSPPFPVFAYSSKAPYVMQASGFDRLSRAGACWLFKGRHSPEAERMLINRQLEDFKLLHGWRRKFLTHFKTFLLITGFLGWAIGYVIASLLK